jgi:hypothetical protein
VRPIVPKGVSLRREDLPGVVALTMDGTAAHGLADRLRAVGADVVLIEEPADPRRTAFCSTHAALLAALHCERCGAAICNQCVVRAEGRAVCDRCRRKIRMGERNTRTRQLFVLFLFTVFLYQVGIFIRGDQERVSPFGPVPMVVVQFVDGPEPNPWIVRALNGEPVTGYVGPGLKDLAQWFDSEHHRYTASSRSYAQITVRGPWPQHVVPPELAGPTDPWWRIAMQSMAFPRYFRGLAFDHGIDARAFGVRAYVVYTAGDGDDIASHSRGAEKGHFAVAYVSLDEKNPAYALASIAHEICHALGAVDLYDESTYLPQHPEGFMEPYRQPLYPQRYAEIMAVDLPIGHGLETEIHSLDQLRIGYRTAADMGWIGEEQAARFYAPPAVQPEELLDEGLLP